MTRKLDALVAERVMGLTLAGERPACFVDGAWFVHDGEVLKNDPKHLVYEDEDAGFCVVPFYSLSVSAAFTLVDAMRAKGYDVDLRARVKGWVADFCRERDQTYGVEFHESLPTAICLAALKAVGVPEAEIEEARKS